MIFLISYSKHIMLMIRYYLSSMSYYEFPYNNFVKGTSYQVFSLTSIYIKKKLKQSLSPQNSYDYLID